MANLRFARWLQGRWYGGKLPPFLLPLSALFGAVTALRRRLIRPVRLPVRVVVIGNLAVGGSGKTPLVAWLARELHQRGVKVGIVTRGYGREEHGIRRVEADTSATAVGDEPRWLAAVTGVPVVVGADRVAAVRALLTDTPVDIVLSDDGLQHYRLARDVEIVAIDARRGLGNGALLPAGPLREPLSRLTRADAVVLKGSDAVALPDLPTVVRMNYRLGPAKRLHDGATCPLAEFRGRAIAAYLRTLPSRP
ncbi:MAG: tetraacyldisaccharide 4'-kinase [Terriglobales bacterium]